MNFFLDNLNEDQKKPVLDTEGAVLVLAGAGSGKTRVLTSRIAHLINDKGVSPRNVLAITFTNKAANEMKARLSEMVDNISDLWVMTIHSMCVRILRANVGRIGYNENFTIYDDNDKDKVIKRICQEMQIDDDKFVKSAKFHISKAKNENLTPEEYLSTYSAEKDIKIIYNIYKKYELTLAHSNSLDFDDLLVKTYNLLSDDQEVREYYSSKFEYIHVDEFQDTNYIQVELIKLLAGFHGNIFVVGDDDQSIYGWRGAEIKNILEFEKSFTDPKIYKLEQNYRSTKKILDLANAIIQHNDHRKNKVLWTENEEGCKIETYLGADENNEAMYTAVQIKSLISRNNYKPSDFAVLMRVNALSRAYEQEFTKYGIPYKVFGGFRFYERKEIKDLLAYLKILNNPLDNESVLRIINYPKRGIGEKAQDALLSYAEEMNLSMFDAVIDVDYVTSIPQATKNKVRAFGDLITELMADKNKLSLPDLLGSVIKKTDYKNLFADNTEENLNKKMNIDEFYNSIEQFCSDNKGAKLSDFLNAVTLSSDTDDINENDNVSIATIHSVKGLEFKCVFICGLDETIFPISRAVGNESELEEERRLMYVAITRARERLYITRARSRFLYGERTYTTPSRFLKELQYKLDNKPQTENKQPVRNYYNDDQDGGSTVIGGYSARFATETFLNKNKPSDKKIDYGKYRTGTKVRHLKFGEGVVIMVKGSGSNTIVDVAFKGIGIKSLSAQFAPMEIIE